MKEAIDYIEKVLPDNAVRELADPPARKVLPIYIDQGYDLAFLDIYHKQVVLVEAKTYTGFNSDQIKKHLDLIADRLNIQPILLLNKTNNGLSRRLVQKDIDFVIPGKQMFMPHLMISLKDQEHYPKHKRDKSALLPSAQLVFLYHLLNNKEHLSELSLKQLSSKFNYTQMAMTNAASNLEHHELCEIQGTKEKHIVFKGDRPELWYRAQPIFINPVFKTVYVDKMDDATGLLKCNGSALPEYTDLNPSRQAFYAIDRNEYNTLIQEKKLKESNDHEGLYCLEIWKYDPKKLADNSRIENIVDPLSLYISLRETVDERIEMGLEQIKKNYIW